MTFTTLDFAETYLLKTKAPVMSAYSVEDDLDAQDERGAADPLA
ncbi:hypothetical protein [Bifidobacterium leontopitheci]|uniref:Uncharacterized protein n=1 Tax=Bifidobacterium leontopitheci TaxID=2650774 RepID=A0A6I1GE12_9BIFI|nr:hypothetical protein [Bifidobacterium leontopitheci]KAB7789870.1 hypothetical protein F7D09_1594 [Bifidobacterium leontopitheci]